MHQVVTRVASHVAKTGMEGEIMGSEGKDGLSNCLGVVREVFHTVRFLLSFHLFTSFLGQVSKMAILLTSLGPFFSHDAPLRKHFFSSL